MTSPSPAPTVSVIVPVRDDRQGLERCLDALAASSYAGPVEVLVIDNGSAEDVAAAVDGRAGVRLLREPRAGSYAARNAGVRTAAGSVIAFTDADCRPDRCWLDRAVARLAADDGPDAVAGRVDVIDETGAARGVLAVHERLHAFPQQRYVEREGFGVTANLVVRAEAVRRIGGFDDRLFSGGDRDFGNRLQEAGMALRYADDVVVRHPPRADVRSYYLKRRRVIDGALSRRAAAGEPVRLRWSRVLRGLAPPRHALRVGLRDPRLRGPRERLLYLVGAVLVRYLDVAARIHAEVARRTAR